MRRSHRLIRRLLALPLLMRAGLILLLIGGAGDLLSHSLTPLYQLGSHFHLLTFAGMALTLAGLLIDAILCARRRRTEAAPPRL